MKPGGLQQRGSTLGFAGIGVDTGDLEKQLQHLRKQVQDIEQQKEIHEAAAKLFKSEMKNNIVSQKPKILKVRRKDSTPWDVPKGTMKRSVAYWLINERKSTYWVGPRAGLKVGRYKDAWFANIVEGDDQYIKGNNRNVGVFERSIKNKKALALKLMTFKYNKAIERSVQAKKRAGKQLKLF